MCNNKEYIFLIYLNVLFKRIIFIILNMFTVVGNTERLPFVPVFVHVCIPTGRHGVQRYANSSYTLLLLFLTFVPLVAFYTFVYV